MVAYKDVYEVFQAWKENCLDQDNSFIFEKNGLWTKKNLQEFNDSMLGNLMWEDGTFLSKLRAQFEKYPDGSDMWLLIAELRTLHYVIALKIKNKLAFNLGGIDSYPLDTIEKITENTEGVINPGQFYAGLQYLGMAYYASIALRYKTDDTVKSIVSSLCDGEPRWGETEETLSPRNIIDSKYKALKGQPLNEEQAPHSLIMPHCLCKKYYAPIISNRHIKIILNSNAFSEFLVNEERVKPRYEQLYLISTRALEKHSDWPEYRGSLDFYDKEKVKGLWHTPKKKNTATEPSLAEYDSTRTKVFPLNQILYGPPGTGKTYHTATYAVATIESKNFASIKSEDYADVRKRFDRYVEQGQIDIVTFHQSLAYEDFMEGIKPIVNKEDHSTNSLGFQIEDGIFKKMAGAATQNPKKNYVLIIDEINRGNISKIFGELITLLEESKRGGNSESTSVTLPYSKEKFSIPGNLYVIGTMNTADRSIALLDTALRRRFEFIEMVPDTQLLEEDVDGIDIAAMVRAINDRITFLLDRDHQLGHSYFMDVDSVQSLKKTFQCNVIPLLQEYFYGDWEKIVQVLNNNGFVEDVQKKVTDNIRHIDNAGDEKVYELIALDSEQWEDPGSYQNIYSKSASE